MLEYIHYFQYVYHFFTFNLFIECSQRLNVALTRAKRVLRVVGDLSFFMSLQRGSTLKPLAKHYQDLALVKATKVQSIAWSPPDWSCQSLWIPTITARFHDSLKNMTLHDKNICFNTVLALSRPDLELIIPRPSQRERISWYITSLRGYNHKLCIVWVPKRRGQDLLIEAHFAGNRNRCNTFIQVHPNVPAGACIALSDLSGVMGLDSSEAAEKHESSNVFTSWPLTAPIQNAIMSNSIDNLPQGNLVLDPHQQDIAVSIPPLLVESRSG